MDIPPASVLVELFDIQAVVGLALLATVLVVVVTAGIRERRPGRTVRSDRKEQP
jgi:hypothetical protein